MARARNIKPGFFESEDPAKVGFPQRLLWIALWTLADREGRLQYRPQRIKKYAFGFDAVTIEQIDQWVKDLHAAGLIVLYPVGNVEVIQCVNFKKHQKPHYKDPESEFPPPPTIDRFPGKPLDDSRIIDVSSDTFPGKGSMIDQSLSQIPGKRSMIGGSPALNVECGMLKVEGGIVTAAPKELPPPAQPSLLEVDPQAEFKRLAGELVQLLPAAGDVNLTARQLEIEYSSSASFAGDPVAFADSVRESAKRWRKAWDQNPALRPKAAQWWLRDSDYARRPPEPAAAKQSGMKRLIDMFPEVPNAS